MLTAKLLSKVILFTGCLLTCIAAEIVIQPLNRSVLFLKEKDMVLTNTNWRIAVEFDMTPYQDVMSTVKEDLLLVKGQRKEYTAISELKQIETLLGTLEVNSSTFNSFYPDPTLVEA